MTCFPLFCIWDHISKTKLLKVSLEVGQSKLPWPHRACNCHNVAFAGMAGICENTRKQLSHSQQETNVKTQTSCDVKPVAPGLPVGSGFRVGGHVFCLCTRATFS